MQNGRLKTGSSPLDHALNCQALGAGELIVTSIDREGTYSGYDCDLLAEISSAVKVPVVANGGAARLADLRSAVIHGGCSAVAASSLFVYSAPGEGVLINYPSQEVLQQMLWRHLN